MAGYFQLPQRVSADGRPYPGAKAYFYEAATLTPLTVYRDYSLGSSHPNPLTADTDGVFEPVFLDEADEFFRYRLTTSAGVVLQDITTLPIVGPSGSEGGGSEVTVDPDSVMKMGSLLWFLGTGLKSGFVRVNGRTIGSATSGASERANADTQALFEHVWGEFSDDICPVSSGRGVSAAADFAANKTITLPDIRGRVLAGLDDMGNSTAGRLTSTTITGGATTLGATGGTQTHTLTEAQMPVHTHGGATGASGAHTHLMVADADGSVALSASNQLAGDYDPGGGNLKAYNLRGSATAATLGKTSESATHTHTVSSAGSGSAHPILQPTFLATCYVKL